MRKVIISMAALLLSACGGQDYPMTASEAFNSLSSIGTTPGMDSLPGGLNPINASFESIPGDNAVVWKFTHDGEDIGRIIAKVDPNGSTSTVNVYYVDGTAPGDHWRNDAARRLIKGQIQRLAVEAVDAKLTNRPFNQDLKRDVDMQVTMASVGSIMEDASKSMDEAVARFDQHDKEREISQAQSQANREARAVGKPTMDLGGSSSR